MSSQRLDIHHSDVGEYYEMFVDGELVGTYDTLHEAVLDYESNFSEEEAEE